MIITDFLARCVDLETATKDKKDMLAALQRLPYVEPEAEFNTNGSNAAVEKLVTP